MSRVYSPGRGHGERRMISIKKHLDDFDSARGRARHALEAYLALIDALQSAAGDMARGEGRQLRDDMARILSYLTPDAKKSDLDRSREEAANAIRALAEVINRREYEYKEIIRIMAQAGATMARTGALHSEELQQAAGKVEQIARLDSVQETRRQLDAHVHELRSIAERAVQQGEEHAKGLNLELEQARAKLERAAALAETDALTGMPNRRAGENAVEAAIADNRVLTVLMLDLNGFKQVNDTYGHAQGDSLLRSVAHHVRRCLREADLVCRWGGDEFLVLLYDTPLDVAHITAARIHQDAFGEFMLARQGENVQVVIGASIGAAERQPNESADALLERADKLMYENKRSAKAATAR
ncbi:MAG TPA: GGDEF domain-containing protein [Terriglobales bacterium]|nr:GGDEF domain-containing protein [Terriglobales bacterium]